MDTDTALDPGDMAVDTAVVVTASVVAAGLAAGTAIDGPDDIGPTETAPHAESKCKRIKGPAGAMRQLRRFAADRNNRRPLGSVMGDERTWGGV